MDFGYLWNILPYVQHKLPIPHIEFSERIEIWWGLPNSYLQKPFIIFTKLCYFNRRRSSWKEKPNLNAFCLFVEHSASYTLSFVEHCSSHFPFEEKGGTLQITQSWNPCFFAWEQIPQLLKEEDGGGGWSFQCVLLVCGQPFFTYFVWCHTQPHHISYTTYACHPGDFCRPDLIVRSQEQMSLPPLENKGALQPKTC